MNTKITLKLLETVKKMVKARMGIPPTMITASTPMVKNSFYDRMMGTRWVIPIMEDHYESIKGTLNICLGEPKRVVFSGTFPNEVMVEKKDGKATLHEPEKRLAGSNTFGSLVSRFMYKRGAR